MKILFYIFIVIALIIIMLLFIPFWIKIKFDDDCKIYLKIFSFNYCIFPNPQNNKNNNFSDDKKNSFVSFIKNIKSPKEFGKFIKTIQFYIGITSDVIICFFALIKKICLKKLELRISVGGEDSQNVAINYAEFSTGIYNILSFLYNLNEPQKYFIDISPNFLSKKININLEILAKIRLFSLIGPVLIFLKKIILSKKYFSYQKQKETKK